MICGMSPYMLASADRDRERRRLEALEGIFDPATLRLLSSTGGWVGRRCLEVGAGGGSIAAWMRDAVGAAGQVVAVDVNATFLRSPSGLDLFEGDVRELALEEGTFDVVHVRNVLIHMGDAVPLLARLSRLLSPTGWLLVEEPDFGAAWAYSGPERLREGFRATSRAIQVGFGQLGCNHRLGQLLPQLVQRCDCELSAVEVDAQAVQGGSAVARMMSLAIDSLWRRYVSSGLASEEQLGSYQRFGEDPLCWGTYFGTVRVLARRRRGAAARLSRR